LSAALLGGTANAMLMGGPVMLSVTVSLLVGSAVETAVMLTDAADALNCAGTEAGAAYIVRAPLAV